MPCASPHALTKADIVSDEVVSRSEHYLRRRTKYRCRKGGETASVDAVECRYCKMQVASGFSSIVDTFWGMAKARKRHCMGLN